MPASQPAKAATVAVKGLALCLGICVASAIFWGIGWNVWIPLAVAGWFAADAILTLRKVNRLVQDMDARDDVLSSGAEGNRQLGLKSGEFGEYSWRGEPDCYGTIMDFCGKTVFIDLRRDKLLESRKKVALKLISNSKGLEQSLKELKAMESKRQPERKDDIMGLEISLIGLYDASNPDGGEVFFTQGSSDDKWTCILKGTEFRDLLLES